MTQDPKKTKLAKRRLKLTQNNTKRAKKIQSKPKRPKRTAKPTQNDPKEDLN